MRYLKLFEEFNMGKVMTMSKEPLSSENQKTFEQLKSLFAVEPTHMKTLAKNLKHIPYKYKGSDEDVLTVFDLDLQSCNLELVKHYIQSSVNRRSIVIPGLTLEYTLSIFINQNGEVIVRFAPGPNNQYDDNKELQQSWTEEFNSVDEMFSFIKDKKLPEMLSQDKYEEDYREYEEEVSRLEKEEEEDNFDTLRKYSGSYGYRR
jgi:hypothetical protein